VNRRPTRAQLLSAYDRTVPDLVADGLRFLFVGINPSLWSGWTGYHFANPTNRLWPVLHGAGLTPRRLQPHETGVLLECGIGVTNLVPRATARADELSREEIVGGPERVAVLAERYRPAWVVVLGLTPWRLATGDRRASIGPQEGRLGGRPVWLLPNPSGLNAGWPLPRLVEAYAALAAAEPPD
jgi:TDG/mug DNA glycosylase family protein